MTASERTALKAIADRLWQAPDEAEAARVKSEQNHGHSTGYAAESGILLAHAKIAALEIRDLLKKASGNAKRSGK